MERLLINDVLLKRYSDIDNDAALVDELLNKQIEENKKKIIVLDDDPTGIQTVHDVIVYTDWSIDSIRTGFLGENKMFYILTNSRGLTSVETMGVHTEITLNILKVAKELSKEFVIVSRGDSTLRGHYPLETKVIKETIEDNSNTIIHGEVIFPFFKEGGRFTIDNIHYVAEGEYLIPAEDTEFAKDKTFGYSSSHLGDWIEEKSKGMYKKGDITYIAIKSLRNLDLDKIVQQLLCVNNFDKVVVNAIDYIDVKIFCIALFRAMSKGRNFLFRTAASFTKVMGGVSDKALLTKQDLIKEKEQNGGLIVVGSYIKKTTEQLEELKNCEFVTFIKFNSHLVLNEQMLEIEVIRVVKDCEALLKNGKSVVVYTKRERLDLNALSEEEALKISNKISIAVTSIIKKLQVRPSFILAKGGITSSDIGVKGLKVKRALVLGQVKPGIPVWLTGDESKFPQMSYIIFPGNVGSKTTLKEVIEILCC